MKQVQHLFKQPKSIYTQDIHLSGDTINKEHGQLYPGVLNRQAIKPRVLSTPGKSSFRAFKWFIIQYVAVGSFCQTKIDLVLQAINNLKNLNTENQLEAFKTEFDSFTQLLEWIAVRYCTDVRKHVRHMHGLWLNRRHFTVLQTSKNASSILDIWRLLVPNWKNNID